MMQLLCIIMDEREHYIFFEKLNIAPGFYTKQMCESMNIKRKYSAGYKNMDITKKRRKIIRGNKKKEG